MAYVQKILRIILSQSAGEIRVKTLLNNKDSTHTVASALVKLQVAGYTIGLKIKEPSLREEIRQAYALFLSDAPAELSVDVELSTDASPQDSACAQLFFNDNRITIQDDCLFGSLDLVKRCGLVKINPIRNDSVNLLYPLGTFLRNAFTLLVALGRDGVVLHAVGVLKNEEVYVFIGPSKAGKSTVARLSLDKVVLSDDLLMIRKVDNAFMVFPTPNWGDKQTGLRQNRPYRIHSMYKLVQDKRVYLERFSPSRAVADMFTTPHIPIASIPQERMLQTFSELIYTLPYYGLHFLPKPSFWACIEQEEIRNGAKREDTCKVG
jgi:hypothetical protein